MQLTTRLNIIGRKNLEKNVSKKIMLANTNDKITKTKGYADAMNPLYYTNNRKLNITNDIRYAENYGYSPYQTIDGRNSLLLFAENSEIQKILVSIANEISVGEQTDQKYPVFPKVNLITLDEEKTKLGKIIQEYIDDVFYPNLYRMLKLKKNGLIKIAKEFLTIGKKAYEIRYDNVIRPKNIEDIVEIDPATLQKIKIDDQLWYIQKTLDGNERILHDNQIILIEWNEFEFGYVSYVDSLRRPFNIMRSMQNAKIMWFAVKSQVRMHINFALGDISRTEAEQKLSQSRDEFINVFEMEDENGIIRFNGNADTVGYHEYFTAETSNSGKPEIEEINTQGPDLTEVDSLQYWEKLFYRSSNVPFDRIDPNSSDTFSFVDVTSIRNIEKQFGKFISSIRDFLEELIMKPLIIQLTLKEVEIGIDLSLLDALTIEWLSLNEYEELALLELMNKKVEFAQNLAGFGDLSDVNGESRKIIPLTWIADNYFDFTEQQKNSITKYRRSEAIWLGFDPDATEVADEGGESEEEMNENVIEENFDDNIDFGTDNDNFELNDEESTDDDEFGISDSDDNNF